MFYPVFDARNVGRYSNLTMVTGSVRKENRVLFTEDYFADPAREWEVRFDNGYPNVFFDEEAGLYRCYYTSFIFDSVVSRISLEDRREFTAYPLGAKRITGLLYAQSKDGVTWEKPALGITEFKGKTDNNILFAQAHGASVFKDTHEKDPSRRYKMIMKHDSLDTMAESFSSDGIHWCAPIPWESKTPAGDTHNHAFYDERIGKYVLITRCWDGVRLSCRCESEDFIHWTEPVEIYRGMDKDDQLYSMPVFRYEDLYLGLGSFYHDGDRALAHNDCVDLELLYSWDTLHWQKVAAFQPFISRSEGVYTQNVPDCGCIYASVPVEEDEDFIFYYMGGNGRHTSMRETSLLRAFAEKHKLAGYKAGENEGLFVSANMRLTEDTITVSADIAPNGYIQPAIAEPPAAYHIGLSPIEGLEFSQIEPIVQSGSSITLKLNAQALRLIRDKRFCLAFKLKNATLYGFTGVTRS